MPLTFEHIFVVALIGLYLAKRYLVGKVMIIDRYSHSLNVSFFVAIALFLGYQFWLDELYVGIFALFLGAMAFAKYYQDVREE